MDIKTNRGANCDFMLLQDLIKSCHPFDVKYISDNHQIEYVILPLNCAPLEEVNSTRSQSGNIWFGVQQSAVMTHPGEWLPLWGRRPVMRNNTKHGLNYNRWLQSKSLIQSSQEYEHIQLLLQLRCHPCHTFHSQCHTYARLLIDLFITANNGPHHSLLSGLIGWLWCSYWQPYRLTRQDVDTQGHHMYNK